MRHWYGPGPRKGREEARGDRPSSRGTAPEWLRRVATLGRLANAAGATLVTRLPAIESRPARSAISVLVSIGVHAAVLGLLALALRGVAQHGGGSVISLDLGVDVGENEQFALAPATDPAGPEQPDQPDRTETSEAERSAAVSSRLGGALERIAAAPVPQAEATPLDRGTTPGTAAPLLDRGTSDASPLDALRESAQAPALDGASFAGVSASRASSVVYAVDGSGAMITSLPFVLEEVRRSVSALADDQRFAVVLFGRRAGDEGGGVRAFPPEGLRRATAGSKAELFGWLDSVRARGASNPLDGLLAAIDREPDVVFLLSRSIRRTDGSGARTRGGDWGPGREAILAELDRANPVRKSIFGPPARPVQVKCVQFLEEDPTGVMRAIAREHGGGPGSYRLLPESELRRR
ncbi:MAG: hypothetical protein RIC49_06280 [Phycisphaerales bacterium]|jgi:hypothetical protein